MDIAPRARRAVNALRFLGSGLGVDLAVSLAPTHHHTWAGEIRGSKGFSERLSRGVGPGG